MCSGFGQNIILILADAAMSAFESIVPALTTEGKISTAGAAAITAYVNTATEALETIVAEIKSGGSTLSKLAEILETVVTAYDQLGAALTPGLSLWVNLANLAVQTLLGALHAEIGPVAVVAADAVKKAPQPIEAGFMERHKIGGLQKRLEAVREHLRDAIDAVAEPPTPTAA